MGETLSVGGGTELSWGILLILGLFLMAPPPHHQLPAPTKMLLGNQNALQHTDTQAQAGTSPTPFTSSLLKLQTGTSSLRSVSLT